MQGWSSRVGGTLSLTATANARVRSRGKLRFADSCEGRGTGGACSRGKTRCSNLTAYQADIRIRAKKPPVQSDVIGDGADRISLPSTRGRAIIERSQDSVATMLTRKGILGYHVDTK